MRMLWKVSYKFKVIDTITISSIVHGERETRYSRGAEGSIMMEERSTCPSNAPKLSAVVHMPLQITPLFYSLIAGGSC